MTKTMKRRVGIEALHRESRQLKRDKVVSLPNMVSESHTDPVFPIGCDGFRPLKRQGIANVRRTCRGHFREEVTNLGGNTKAFSALVLGLGRELFYFSETQEESYMIRIEHLSKIYQTKTQVDALKDISLHVQPGDIYGIIGMSGAGKSTLLRCISFLEQPTSGSIFLDGTDMSSVSPRQLQEIRKEMGVIFQGYNLLMQKTIRKNIAFPLELNKTPKTDIDKRVDELLRIVGLSDKADFYPAQLSGGQRQRVAIARALATNPKVLLCDEPTSALDPLTTRSILELLRDINRNLGVTIIVITHELGVVRSLCQKVAVIDQGSIVEQGLTAQVMDAPQNDITKLLISTAGGR